jgi:hypothetical protein
MAQEFSNHTNKGRGNKKMARSSYNNHMAATTGLARHPDVGNAMNLNMSWNGRWSRGDGELVVLVGSGGTLRRTTAGIRPAPEPGYFGL